jgi:hypothetical protein
MNESKRIRFQDRKQKPLDNEEIFRRTPTFNFFNINPPKSMNSTTLKKRHHLAELRIDN